MIRYWFLLLTMRCVYTFVHLPGATRILWPTRNQTQSERKSKDMGAFDFGTRFWEVELFGDRGNRKQLDDVFQLFIKFEHRTRSQKTYFDFLIFLNFFSISSFFISSSSSPTTWFCTLPHHQRALCWTTSPVVIWGGAILLPPGRCLLRFLSRIRIGFSADNFPPASRFRSNLAQGEWKKMEKCPATCISREIRTPQQPPPSTCTLIDTW